ncbi:MAG: hypothetical protein KDA80_11845, partial [Planctomycetaceae bacterium]|nr:hypothetical protein [Planctomycetaceae bacterium]
MIIIYRGWGLALLGAAIVLFPMLFLATGSFSVPVVAIAALWIWLGRRKFDEETGEDIPAPSVFFIPVWFYGALLTIPALGFVGIEVA